MGVTGGVTQVTSGEVVFHLTFLQEAKNFPSYHLGSAVQAEVGSPV